MKFIGIILMILISLGLNSCTFIIQSFLRNFSDNSLTVSIDCRSCETLGKGENYMLFNQEILEINRRTYQKTNQKIDVEIIDNQLSFIMPPKSTVYLRPFFWTSTQNTDTFRIKGIIRENGMVADTLELAFDSATNNFKKTGGLLLKNIYYFDYRHKNAR
jgi:hypothetical protein